MHGACMPARARYHGALGGWLVRAAERGCRSTPWKVTTLGFVFLSSAAAATMLLPGGDTAELVTRAALTTVLAGGGVAVLAAASLIFDIQSS